MDKSPLVLFDASALVHRAYHAFAAAKPLTISKTGEVTSAVYGFANMLLKVLGELKPGCYAMAFDMKGPTFRHEMYDQYKAHRKATPEELISQLGRVRQLVEAFNIPIFELRGYEADDILGALALQASRQGLEVIIVTGDADMMQLVTPNVKVLYPKRGGAFSDTMLYDEAAVAEKYGVAPARIADLKALVGDSSDNIPGVSGIGQKTGVKLIQQFGSIDDIYARIDEVTPEKLQDRLRQNEAAARQSKKLATIVTRLPVELKLDECRVSNFDRQKVTDLFRELEFGSLLSRLPQVEMAVPGGGSKPAAAAPKREFHVVDDEKALHKLVARLKKAGAFAFDTETTGLDTMTAQLVGISLSPAPGEAYYIPVGHVGWGEVRQLELKQVIDALKPLFADKKLAKTAHNAKYDITIVAEHGMAVNNLVFDTMLAAYLLGEKSISLKALSFSRLGIECQTITELIGKGAKQISMSQVEIARAAEYACDDADITGRLAGLFEPDLKRLGLWSLFADVELPLVPVLVAMERNGIALDTELLNQMSQRLGKQLLKLEGDIYDHVGHPFNIKSPKQLGPVLFEELGLPAARKTKTGYSTDASVLEGLKDAHPVIALILEYRQLAKLKSTYIDALPALVNSRTKRLHTSFNQTRTATGRLSSSEPNLQNIPIRGELGREIRTAFVAPRGSQLLAGDYSQIDLRVLAHLSGDPGLVDAFRADEDIHAATAVSLFGDKTTEVTADMRRLAKTVNFGVIYGMSGYGLEQATELSREEANQYITAYFEKYPGVKDYLEATKLKAREQGYVQTVLGRRRYLPDINSANRMVREAAERMAINMPVQGTSADIIKVAMVQLNEQMMKLGLKSKLLLQVHDELIFEVPDEELARMRELVPRIMAGAIKLDVPLKVDVKTGGNWGQME
jgi:DNA polymerase-1